MCVRWWSVEMYSSTLINITQLTHKHTMGSIIKGVKYTQILAIHGRLKPI